MKNSRSRTRGISLVEASVALAVLAVLAASAAPSFRDAFTRKSVEGLAAELGATLQYARSEAQSRAAPVRLSVFPSPSGSCAVVHTGDAADCRCEPGSPAACSGGAQLLRALPVDSRHGIRLEANVASMLFDPALGTATPAGTWRVVSPTAGSVHHVVNVLGRVRTCSPGGALPGFRPC